MKKIYCLSTCSTCSRILKDIDAHNRQFVLQDIRTEKITPGRLEEMRRLSGSYESLFSKRALKYKEWGLKDKSLDEADYRRLILEEYTFLKRPVVMINRQLFAGSEKKTILELMLDCYCKIIFSLFLFFVYPLLLSMRSLA